MQLQCLIQSFGAASLIRLPRAGRLQCLGTINPVFWRQEKKKSKKKCRPGCQPGGQEPLPHPRLAAESFEARLGGNLASWPLFHRDDTERGQIGAIPGGARPAPPVSPRRPDPIVSDWPGCISSISRPPITQRRDTAHKKEYSPRSRRRSSTRGNAACRIPPVWHRLIG